MNLDGTLCILFIGTEETLRDLKLPCLSVAPGGVILGARLDMVLNSIPEFSEREEDWFKVHILSRMVSGAKVLTVCAMR